jgi:hypothetical protein
MNLSDSQKSSLIFILACIPARIGLSYLAYKRSFKFLPIITTLIGIGFLYIYFTGSRKTGTETFGKPIWWNNARLFHGLLFIAYSILAILGCDNAWILLAFDVAFGIGGFVQHKL